MQALKDAHSKEKEHLNKEKDELMKQLSGTQNHDLEKELLKYKIKEQYQEESKTQAREIIRFQGEIKLAEKQIETLQVELTSEKRKEICVERLENVQKTLKAYKYRYYSWSNGCKSGTFSVGAI